MAWRGDALLRRTRWASTTTAQHNSEAHGNREEYTLLGDANSQNRGADKQIWHSRPATNSHSGAGGVAKAERIHIAFKQ